MESNNPAFVYLFNADEQSLNSSYGYFYDKSLFDVVIRKKLHSGIYSSIYSGDVLLLNFSDQIVEVSKKSRPYNSTSTTYSVSKDILITIATYLADSIMERKNSISVYLADFLMKHNIYGIMLTNLIYKASSIIDEGLTKVAGYLGCFELDLGNPLHIIFFIDYLCPHGYIQDGFLNLNEGTFSDEVFPPDWARENHDIGIAFLPENEYQITEPKISFPIDLSDEGKKIVKVLEAKKNDDHYQRIAIGLINETQDEDFHFEISEKFNFTRIDIPKSKFLEYSLNDKHPKGKDKAKLFKELLAIRKQDWKFLAAQIVNGFPDAKIQNVRATQYGIKYFFDIPIIGMNGKSKIVRTAWITSDHKTIRLVTIYITEKGNQTTTAGIAPKVSKRESKDINLIYKTVFQFAKEEGETAAARIVPTPMYIDGFIEPVMDGEIGFADIIITDGRNGFVKWLKKNNIGYKYYKKGFAIPAKAPGQSIERAKAYAEAFAKILKQNDIECYTIHRLD
ncbi:MAG TPA: hypothetical protein DIW44_00030 [Anaerolineaceae bacterium]|nr:hypothetical protein [Anaerolineaceae bacterium]